MENALTHKSPAVQIFLAKNWLGMRDITDVDLGAGAKIQIAVMPAMAGARPDKEIQAAKQAARLAKGDKIKGALPERAGPDQTGDPQPEKGNGGDDHENKGLLG